MESGTLRLILAVAGVLLLAGIYYFGQKKQREERPQAHEWQDNPPPEEAEIAEDMGPWVSTEASDGELLDHELEQLNEVVAETEYMTEAVEELSENPFDSDVQQDLFAEEQAEMTTLADSDLPQKILQIMIVSHAEPFSGERIQQAAESAGLQHGDMQIFHRIAAHAKQPLFSMASMVEPGNFPIDKMVELSTPGLALFAQLPAAKPGMEIYDEMITTAEKLAEELNGELLDATHSVLSKQTIEHTRGEIIEHQRQVNLASKRL
ncbi:MAG: hypothetical protein L3J28_05060 [Candidatus Polarisedimenticolaceae bacterium]|nr:hypothetical protein [Candidatus Polarisedimenticolaceae bacterium]